MVAVKSQDTPKSERETAKSRDDALRRALSTPPKPKPSKKKPKGKKSV
jgi:hypothetical protein